MKIFGITLLGRRLSGLIKSVNYTKIRREQMKSTFKLLGPENGSDYLRVSKDHFKKTFNILKAEEDSDFVFKNGTMSIRYKNGTMLSTKLPIYDLEGSFPSEKFVSITKMRKDYLRLKMNNQNQLIIKGGTYRAFNIFPVKEDNFQLDLWDDSIQWQRCPRDLIEGLRLVAKIAIKGLNKDGQIAFSGPHIVDGYVIAVDYVGNRAARYKLSFSVPFDISLSSVCSKMITARFKNIKLLNVAEVTTQHAGKIHKGMAFNFGDTRAYVPAVMSGDLSNRKDKRDIDHLDPSEIASLTQKHIRSPSIFLIPIQPRMLKYVPRARKTPLRGYGEITISFMEKKILFHYGNQNESAEAEDVFPLKGFSPKSEITLTVNASHFNQAIRSYDLMGVIIADEINGDALLYFRNINLEHVMRARLLNGRK
jgi:hypothetical protein